MGKVESILKSEMIRLAKRETKKTFAPLNRDVRSLKGIVSQLRKSVLVLQRFVNQQERQARFKPVAELTPEEIKKSRFSPQLLQSLRKHLGITQKQLAVLAGVTVGAVQKWEAGTFRPKEKKKGVLVALRKLSRREVRKLLEERRSA